MSDHEYPIPDVDALAIGVLRHAARLAENDNQHQRATILGIAADVAEFAALSDKRHDPARPATDLAHAWTLAQQALNELAAAMAPSDAWAGQIIANVDEPPDE